MPKVIEQSTPEEQPVEPDNSTEVELNEETGEATLKLTNGIAITLKEPKAKDFVYLASRMQSAPVWQRTEVMSVYMLAHFMITSVDNPGAAGAQKPPEFDEFMDWLEDDDLTRVSAALSLFPDIAKRFQAFANRSRSSASNS